VPDFHLQDDFIDEAAEQAIIASVAREPALYWQLVELLPDRAFALEQAVWKEVATAVAANKKAEPPADWAPAVDPEDTAKKLADLYRRRLMAQMQERIARALYDTNKPASELVALVQEEANRIQAAVQEAKASQLTWASDLLYGVLASIEERWETRKKTGKAVMGLPTSLPGLDEILGGLEAGLYLLGGPPGVGKTTLAFQMAGNVAPIVPVVYTTFENSPQNLLVKALAAKKSIRLKDVRRGYADPVQMREAAEEWLAVAQRLAPVQGSARLTVAQLQAKALEAMNYHKTEKCLIIVDYLQLWAKASEELRGLMQVRERVEVLGTSLREMAMRLGCPVVALSSQNRSQGDYGRGKGNASLDSLKESGDLEYAADVVVFLTPRDDPGAMKPAVPLKLTVSKNRDGDTGELDLILRPDIATVRERSYQ
jgi:replicative DNA helicase